MVQLPGLHRAQTSPLAILWLTNLFSAVCSRERGREASAACWLVAHSSEGTQGWCVGCWRDKNTRPRRLGDWKAFSNGCILPPGKARGWGANLKQNYKAAPSSFLVLGRAQMRGPGRQPYLARHPSHGVRMGVASAHH